MQHKITTIQRLIDNKIIARHQASSVGMIIRLSTNMYYITGPSEVPLRGNIHPRGVASWSDTIPIMLLPLCVEIVYVGVITEPAWWSNFRSRAIVMARHAHECCILSNNGEDYCIIRADNIGKYISIAAVASARVDLQYGHLMSVPREDSTPIMSPPPNAIPVLKYSQLFAGSFFGPVVTPVSPATPQVLAPNEPCCDNCKGPKFGAVMFQKIGPSNKIFLIRSISACLSNLIKMAAHPTVEYIGCVPIWADFTAAEIEKVICDTAEMGNALHIRENSKFIVTPHIYRYFNIIKSRWPIVMEPPRLLR